MFEINEVEEILEEIATELPQALYNELNGGILLLPQAKRSPVGRNNDLYIMGEYHSGGEHGPIYCHLLWVLYEDIWSFR